MNRFIQMEFSEALRRRWLELTTSLKLDLVVPGLFTVPVLTATSCIISRAFTEWANPILGDQYQDPTQLDFAGDQPFPHPRFILRPNGTIKELRLQPELSLGEMLGGFGYVRGHPRGASLRDVERLEIRLCIYRAQDPRFVRITIYRQDGGIPRITFSVGLQTRSYRWDPFVWAVIRHLFFSVGTALRPVPALLRQSQLHLCVKGHGPGGIVHFGSMSPEERQYLAILLSALQLPEVVPSSTLKHMLSDRVFSLDMVLFDEVGG
jgi:hypothetical protein